MPQFSPAYDNKIAQKYSAKSLDRKIQNKTALQKNLGWPQEPKIPLLCLPAGMSDELGGKLLQELLPGLLSLNIEIIIRGKGSNSYGALFTKLAEQNSHRIAIIPDHDDGIRSMVAAADMALFCASPERTAELTRCLQYGVVPVSPKANMLQNYNPAQESGNAFLYEHQDAWSAFAAIVRATETYKLPFDWRTIQKSCMEDR